jgi:hypothetical protein
MKADMSAKAVTARLKLTSQLRRLCLSLGQARPGEPRTKAARDSISSSSSHQQHNAKK